VKNAKELMLEYIASSVRDPRKAAVMFAGTRSSLLSRSQDREKL
jgi:hypothetical protein